MHGAADLYNQPIGGADVTDGGDARVQVSLGIVGAAQGSEGVRLSLDRLVPLGGGAPYKMNVGSAEAGQHRVAERSMTSAPDAVSRPALPRLCARLLRRPCRLPPLLPEITSTTRAARGRLGLWTETSPHRLSRSALATWDSIYGVVNTPPQVALLRVADRAAIIMTQGCDGLPSVRESYD